MAYPVPGGQWRTSDGSQFNSQAEAEAYENGGGAPDPFIFNPTGSNLSVQAPVKDQGAEDAAHALLRQNQTNNIDKKAYQGFGSVELPTDIVGHTVDGSGNRVDIVRGTPEGDAAYNAKLGTVDSAGFHNGVQQLNFTPPPGFEQPKPSDAPPVQQSAEEHAAKQDVADATQTATDTHTEDRGALKNAIDNINYDDTQSQETRQVQQRALTLQSDLLDRILGFDPNQYAKQFADESLARSTALARSAGGTAASRTANIQAALDKAPELYGEGQRQASTLENQRLNAAQAAVGKFADVAYGVRSQDSEGEQFKTKVSEDVATQLGALMTSDDTFDTNMLKNATSIYLDLVRNTYNWASLDETQRHSLVAEALANRGMDESIREFNKTHKDKDFFSKVMETVDSVASTALHVAPVVAML